MLRHVVCECGVLVGHTACHSILNKRKRQGGDVADFKSTVDKLLVSIAYALTSNGKTDLALISAAKKRRQKVEKKQSKAKPDRFVLLWRVHQTL